MAQQVYEKDNDGERREAVRTFFLIYNFLKEKRALRWNGHSDLKSAWIEIWEYKNNGETKVICRVRAETDTDCYRMAAEQLKWEANKKIS